MHKDLYHAKRTVTVAFYMPKHACSYLYTHNLVHTCRNINKNGVLPLKAVVLTE